MFQFSIHRALHVERSAASAGVRFLLLFVLFVLGSIYKELLCRPPTSLIFDNFLIWNSLKFGEAF